MPLGEIIGEVILRPILELVLYGLTYWTGYPLLKAVTFGSIRLAPLTSIEEKNRSKRKWHQIDWSIWLHRPMQGRALKAECTCLVGMLVWAAVGFAIYFGTRDDNQTANKASISTPDPWRVESIMTIQPKFRSRRSENSSQSLIIRKELSEVKVGD
jgi:hypothetical protein